jgi:uncharacterized protein YecT (DUF1311 family)
MTNLRCVLAFFLIVTAALTTANAASFDCGKATSRVERLICTDHELSDLDDALAAAYQTRLAEFPIPDDLRREQRHWLKKRDVCPDSDCVRRTYQRRLDEVAALATIPPEMFADDVFVELWRGNTLSPIVLYEALQNCDRGFFSMGICATRDFISAARSLKKVQQEKLALLPVSCRDRLTQRQRRWELSQDKDCDQQAESEGAGGQVWGLSVTACGIKARVARTAELELITKCSDIPR